MDWEEGIKELFETLTDQVPEGVRTAVKPILYEASEETAKLRNSGVVSKDDLISALFKITPEALQAMVIELLNSIYSHTIQ